MIGPMRERRVRRSTQRFEASELYLEAARARAKAKAVVLASDDGLVVSGAGAREAHEVLAAVAPNAHSELAQSFGCTGAVHASRLELDGSTFFLASLGGSPIPPDEASAALSRILMA